MSNMELEHKIRSSSAIEAWVSGISVVAALIGYFWLTQLRVYIGCLGFFVWIVYTLLYLGQFGPGRSWLGAFLPGCVAFLFLTWALHG